jgi:hypothetical protein
MKVILILSALAASVYAEAYWGMIIVSVCLP